MKNEATWAVVLTGPPGVGKSTTGRHLARAIGAALLDLDTITNPLVDVIASMMGAEGDYSNPDLAQVVRGPRYSALVNTAVDCLSADCPVVLIAPFTSERRNAESWRKLADRLTDAGGEPVLAWLRADATLLAMRMRGRAAGRDVEKLAALENATFVPDLDPPRVPHLEIDASLTAAEQVNNLVRTLISRRS